jgi:hypothetical protein
MIFFISVRTIGLFACVAPHKRNRGQINADVKTEHLILCSISGNFPEMADGRSNISPLASYRQRMKRRGFVRVEVLVQRHDAALVREVAEALSDPVRQEAMRTLLRERLAAAGRPSLKALLAGAPLEGIDLDRSKDTGRPVEL